MDDCTMMSDDIFSSIEVIKQVDDKTFKKVMETYKSKCKNYVDLISKQLPSLLTVENINLTDFKKLSENLIDLTKVKFGKNEGNPCRSGDNKVYFSFEKQKHENNHKINEINQNQK